MICKDGAIDVISIGGGGGSGSGGCGPNGNGASTNGHNTLQNRRKSQLITFSSSSCDIKNSLSHEIIMVNNSQYTTNNNNINSSKSSDIGGSRTGSVSGRGSCIANNTRLSYAEEDLLLVTNGVSGVGVGAGAGSSTSGSGSNTGSGSGGSAGSGHEADLEDDVFRRRSLEVDDEVEVDFDDEFETHIEGGSSNNANDDSGGGSYEDSHALQSSIGGSNRNSLEKDDDEIDVDVISTDVSCYDQLLGSSCNTRNDDDIATIVGDIENFTKLCKNGSITTGLNGSSVNGGGGVGVGENCGIIYANPFMDDEGIAESGM